VGLEVSDDDRHVGGEEGIMGLLQRRADVGAWAPLQQPA
jgi:hypothetical protein